MHPADGDGDDSTQTSSGSPDEARRARRAGAGGGATREVPGTASGTRLDTGDVPERAETTPLAPRAERARVSGGDDDASRRVRF